MYRGSTTAPLRRARALASKLWPCARRGLVASSESIALAGLLLKRLSFWAALLLERLSFWAALPEIMENESFGTETRHAVVNALLSFNSHLREFASSEGHPTAGSPEAWIRNARKSLGSDLKVRPRCATK